MRVAGHAPLLEEQLLAPGGVGLGGGLGEALGLGGPGDQVVGDRVDLGVIMVRPEHWEIFDASTTATEWLGEIHQHADCFCTSHEELAPRYRFKEFARALSYFEEYALAVRSLK